MKKSKIAVFIEAKKPICLQEIAIPKLKTGQILVENQYTTLCRSDLNTFCGKRIEKSPTILGHEVVGKIARMSNVAPLKDINGNALHIGDRITWAIYSSNPESELSKRGIPQKAENLFKYGHEEIKEDSNLHGGLAQYTILRANTPIVKLPCAIPDKTAALINCSIATVAGAIRLAGEIEGKNILVSGAGMLGMVACAMAHSMGAASVSVIDIDMKRSVLARDFGAQHIIDSGSYLRPQLEKVFFNPNPFHVVLEFSGAASAMENTLKTLGIGGVAVWVGGTFPQRNLSINSEYTIRNLTTIKGLHNYNDGDLVKAVQFFTVQHNNYPFSKLVVDYGGLEDINEAFEHGLRTNAFRIGIHLSHNSNK